MPKIIKIEPVVSVFSITWNIGLRCNYDCMYCPPQFHNNNDPHASLTELQRRWLSILQKTSGRNLKYKISFTGGEVTANKNFLPLIQWMRNNYADRIYQILLTTNGSASKSYYAKLLNSVDNISFSFHSEHADEQKFFSMVIDLAGNLPENKHIHVNIMNEFWNQDRIKKYVDLLNLHGVPNQVNEVNYALQTRPVPILKGKLNLDI